MQRVNIIIKVYGTGSRDYGCEHVLRFTGEREKSVCSHRDGWNSWENNKELVI